MSNHEASEQKQNLPARIRAALGVTASKPATDQLSAPAAGLAEKDAETARLRKRFRDILAANTPPLPAEGMSEVSGVITQKTAPGYEYTVPKEQQQVTAKVIARYAPGTEAGDPATTVAILGADGYARSELTGQIFREDADGTVVTNARDARETAVGSTGSRVEPVPGSIEEEIPVDDDILRGLEYQLRQTEWPKANIPANPALPSSLPALPPGTNQ